MALSISKLLLPILLLMGGGPALSPAADKQTGVLPEKPLNEPERIIHCGDLVKITVRVPGRAFGSMEAVDKEGDVATPEGSFIRAGGLSLAAFRTNLAAVYANLSGYEQVQIETHIASSPYSIVKPEPVSPAPSNHPSGKASINASTNAPPSAKGTLPPPPGLHRRIFKTPLTIWQAVQSEGGIPPHVDPRHIRILKANMARKTLDCSGKEGAPDGATPVETNDCIFLVPDDVPVSKIFD